MTVARKRDLTMETFTCQSMEEEKSMGMNVSILATPPSGGGYYRRGSGQDDGDFI